MVVLLFCLLSTTGAMAGENGAFALESSSVANDAKDVSCQPLIALTFNKNVVNLKITEQNKTCFTLLDKEDKAIEIEVIMADDQVEPEKKRIISVKPVAPLQPQTAYRLLISKKLTSKSGDTLPEDISIAFTTGDKDADQKE